ncbi:MAG: hypothetical protein E5Y59_03240 [Mesorhizobium sp.]|nr:MAG: hypothetical protein E5Y59_03240 [Mesorhizobium sp.]
MTVEIRAVSFGRLRLKTKAFTESVICRVLRVDGAHLLADAVRDLDGFGERNVGAAEYVDDVVQVLIDLALWDAAFDGGLVSFSDDGPPLFSPLLGDQSRKALRATEISPLVGLTNSHCKNLA